MLSDQRSLHSLERLINLLQEGYARHFSTKKDLQIRDGLILRYKYLYEKSHKMLKRHLEMTAPNPDIYDSMSFADLIRSGNERALLRSDWTKWKVYREMRAKTSNTYDESTAIEVVSVVSDFILEAKYLLGRLQKNSF
jgi:nucleotidyltransferase substrate binding protein (TIGR01987 family)